MITLRSSKERHHDRRRRHEEWSTFDPDDQADLLGAGFGALEQIDEDRLPPGAGIPRQVHQAGELVTYVREGALAYEDSMGRTGVIHTGEFHRMTVGPSLRHSETNASRADWVHVFQIWLRPPVRGLEPNREQKRFSAAQRRGILCVIASADARRGSLRLHQDATLYSTLLAPGQHVVHELSAGRRGWIHVVHGQVIMSGEHVLSAGDSAGVFDERVVSVTARHDSEFLLFDVADPLVAAPSIGAALPSP